KKGISCRQDIAARLSSRYANLNAPSSRDVTVIQSDSMDFTNRNFADGGMMGQDINNNVVTEVQQDPQPDRPPKIKYDLPKDHKSTKLCICSRLPTAYECHRCHQYFFGRLSQSCEKHQSEVFLMDFRECPYCMAPTHKIQESSLTWEDIRKIEDGPLPDDAD
ncbi:hypothetical protein KR009_007682, partial [Drosophila setifemur]